jgi:acyl transferase domain-containing protein
MRALTDLAGQYSGADVHVAVIGMAARAAGAPDLDALWRRIESARDVITDIPPDRIPGFDAERLGARPPRGALLDRIDAFDAGFFGLSPRQAAYMDPRQRLLLEETWHALEDACVDPATLADSAAGVFVGATGADFRLRCDGLGAIDQYTAAGTMDAFLANRISYQLGTCAAPASRSTPRAPRG